MRTLVLSVVLAVAACAPDPGAEERAVRTLVFEQLSQPDLGAVVGPAVLQNNFAVVDWTRGNLQGGRTLLRKDKGQWAMVLCGGQPLRNRPTLERAGVPDGTAGQLLTKLLREESRVGIDRRNQLDKFRGARTDGKHVACPEARRVG